MKALGLSLLLTVLACGGTGESVTTTIPTAEPDRLIGELRSAGAEVDQAESFTTEPLGGQGLLLCVEREEVRVYLFGSGADAEQAAARIDPDDPSNLGNAIVEWVGQPRFWQRGPMLVLYLGEDPMVEDLLTQMIGPPFARGADAGRGLAGLPSACSDS
ncbi:MAG: hypothetical protein LC739_06510 [Actinobacteria bacterium]|nr:hypothetical protein [Actinomycetota bacterium]